MAHCPSIPCPLTVAVEVVVPLLTLPTILTRGGAAPVCQGTARERRGSIGTCGEEFWSEFSKLIYLNISDAANICWDLSILSTKQVDTS